MLDQNESVRTLRPTQISSKAGQEAKKAVGLDKDDHEFRVGDQMREYLGEVSSRVRFVNECLLLCRADVAKYCTFIVACMSFCTVKTMPKTVVFSSREARTLNLLTPGRPPDPT